MAKIKGAVRTNQVITTYGIGALVAVGDESFIVGGLDRWPAIDPDIHEPRLQRMLGVSGFVRPPSQDGGQDIPVFRFPKVHYCPSCYRLAEFRQLAPSLEDAICSACVDEPTLVPSRFIVGCDRGHLDEFPFFEWVHAGKKLEPGTKHELSFRAEGLTAALRDVVISCSCKESASMDGAFGRDALREFGTCRGKRPWLGAEATESCSSTPRVLQRGASNVWFAVTASALSIPPWSEAALRALDKHWNVLRYIPDDTLEQAIQGFIGGMQTVNIPVAELVEAIRQRKQQDGVGDAIAQDAVKAQEYQALVRGRAESDPGQEFVCEPVAVSADMTPFFESVHAVTRLREVRVLTGFTRLMPLGQGDVDDKDQIAALSADDASWLPAVDVIGEGVFIRMSEDRLSQWEQEDAVRQRVEALDANFRQRAARFGAVPQRVISARLVLVHTLAHVLIDQWTLDSGYPTASLRERLYVGDDMAGLLVYTATSDSAGSLGGVVAMADESQFAASVRVALERAAWCSSDPLCIESGAQGADGLNLAACHSCALVPETSCEEMNAFLDRATLIGTLESSGIGYFAELIGGN